MCQIWPLGRGFPIPCGSAGEESACSAGDLGSVPGLGRFPWRRERLPTPVFWPGEFHGLQSWGHKESDTTKRLLLSHHSGCYALSFSLRAWHMTCASVSDFPLCSPSLWGKAQMCLKSSTNWSPYSFPLYLPFLPIRVLCVK